MISIRQKGDFSKTEKYLRKLKSTSKNFVQRLNKYGQEGVNALASATPVDTGKTAASWKYKIEERDGSLGIAFYNTNVVKYVNIAIIIQYGHATRTGVWVEGRDYINPAIQPIFDRIADDVWKEVTGL
jgi:hypothetical protein